MVAGSYANLARYLFLSARVSALFLPSITYALVAPAAAPEDAPTLEEVIVTAERRSENIQSVPMQVTAVGGETLARTGVFNTQDIQQLVPALNFASNTGFAQPYLRGIGSDINVPGAENSVATFVDGVYIEQQQGQITNLLGVDRVEVLEGPQGTLYGRNTSGGAINVYTLTPAPSPDLQASATLGNLSQRQFTGHVSGGMTDTLSVGLYVAAADRDSVYNYLPLRPASQPTDNRSYGVRLKAVWQPVGPVKFTGSIEHTYTRSDDTAFRQVQSNAIGYLFGATPVNRPYQISEDSPSFNEASVTTGILREEFDLGFAQLVGISGHRDLHAQTIGDIDGTNAPVIAVGAPILSTQFSQEMQLLSPASSPVSWIAGLYYFSEHGTYNPFLVTSPILFQPASFTSLASYTPERTLSYAGFAQATVPLSFITSGLQLTLGGRHTEDQKKKLADFQQPLGTGDVPIGPGTVFPGAAKTFARFTPKISLEYQLQDALYYITYAQGFKSGTFNTDVPADNTYVQPEILTDYEGGVKSDWFDRRLRINADVYYYDLKNLQVQVLDPTNGVQTELRNAASALAYGLEVSAIARVTNSLTFNANVSLENSKYVNFSNAPFYVLGSTGNTEILGVSASGHQLQRAPKLVGTVGANYRIPLSRGDEINIDGSVYHNGGFTWDPAGQDHQAAYTLLDASLGYTTPGHQWTGRLWVKNATDEYYRSFVQINSFGTAENDPLPRTFGITFEFHL